MNAVSQRLEKFGLDPAVLWPAGSAGDGSPITANRHELVVARGLWLRAQQLSDDPGLGAKVGASLPVQAANVLAILGAHAPTYRAALDHVFRFQSLLSESGRFRPETINDGLRVVYVPSWPELPIASLQIDSVVASLLRGRPRPVLVRLVGRQDGDPRVFSSILRCPVTLGAAQASIDYRDTDIDRLIPGADPGLHDIALVYAESLLRIHNRHDEIRRSVRAAIALIGPAAVTMTAAAEKLGCSSRTLQRRLDGIGERFRNVLHSYRMEEAGVMLTRTDVSIDYISNLLGYSDPSAFSRAVRSWWGESPRALKRRKSA